MKKYIILLVIILAAGQNLFSRDIPGRTELEAGLSADIYSDFASYMTVNEGIIIKAYRNLVHSAADSSPGFGLDLGLKSGVLFEGATSMQRPFAPELFPLYIPLCPSIRLYADTGSVWRFHIYSAAGPYLTFYSDPLPDFRLDIEGGIGLSCFCFRNSGFSLDLRYSLFGKGDLWSGFGLDLLYSRKIEKPK